jgi:thioredoxin 1
MVQSIADQEFASKVLASQEPVIVDFWAPWCGPCKSLAPILDELSTDLAGKVTIFKMNVDENSDTPANYGIRSIPTLIFFEKGKPAKTLVGPRDKAVILDAVLATFNL